MTKARRYNKAKNRVELVPTGPILDIADVYTRGAHKYTIYTDKEGNKIKGSSIPFEERDQYEVVDDGADNWRKGMSWKNTIGSVKRHISAWDEGEDLDSELGTKHLANAAWGLITLLEYYKIAPHFDDRDHRYLNRPKIGLDIDEVLCNWVDPWCKKFGYDKPCAWNFSYINGEHFKSLMGSGEFDDFYANLPRLIDPNDIPFEPHCYITSRSVPIEVTKKWLQKNGFPTAPVYSVGFGESKVEIAKSSGLDIYVEDRYENFLELNKAGVCTYLWDAPHNQRYDVGYKRIKTFKELV